MPHSVRSPAPPTGKFDLDKAVPRPKMALFYSNAPSLEFALAQMGIAVQEIEHLGSGKLLAELKFSSIQLYPPSIQVTLLTTSHKFKITSPSPPLRASARAGVDQGGNWYK